MATTSAKIRSFTDLIAWREGHELVLSIYKLTKNLPSKEIFGITSQIQRASVSVTSNIAEGFGRQSPKEETQFFYISLGSIKEVQNLLIIAKDIGYINATDFETLAKQTAKVSQLLNGLIRSSKRRIEN